MVKIKKEFKELIPELQGKEYSLLEESIIKEGCREPISLWKDFIVDGHNRYQICNKHKIQYMTKEIKFDSEEDVIIWIINNQLGRRNLLDIDRFILTKKKHEMTETVTETDTVSETVTKLGRKPREDLANELGWSIGKAQAYSYVVTNHPEKVDKVREDKISVWDILKKDKKENRKEDIKKQKEELTKLAPFKEKYDVIVIDPPWNYGGDYDPDGRRVANPYPEMNIEELKKMKIPSDENCILWLWTTNDFIREAYTLLDTWGFEAKTILTWDKKIMGIGHWLRGQTEHCILAIKGKPLWNNTIYTTLLSEQRTKHSKKPEGFYKMVDKLCAGKKLDYFNRGRKRDGWDSYGN